MTSRPVDKGESSGSDSDGESTVSEDRVDLASRRKRDTEEKGRDIESDIDDSASSHSSSHSSSSSNSSNTRDKHSSKTKSSAHEVDVENSDDSSDDSNSSDNSSNQSVDPSSAEISRAERSSTQPVSSKRSLSRRDGHKRMRFEMKSTDAHSSFGEVTTAATHSHSAPFGIIGSAVASLSTAVGSTEERAVPRKRRKKARSSQTAASSSSAAVDSSKGMADVIVDSSVSANRSKAETTREKKKKKKKKRSRKSKHKKTAPPSPVMRPTVEIQEYYCLVCQDLPPAKIYQCAHGHFLCESCHKRILESKKPNCPVCRIKMNRRHPARNRFAEKVLASMQMECDNDGCGMKVRFAQLQKHSEEECEYRVVSCKYAPLGCDWTGLAREQRRHKKVCAVRRLDARHILKKVKQRNERAAQKHSAEMALLQRYASVSRQWESRCRCIEAIDCVFDPGQVSTSSSSASSSSTQPSFQTIRSRAFNAFNEDWVLEIKIDKQLSADKCATTAPRLKIRVVPESRLRWRLPAHVAVFNGPDNAFRFPLVSFDAEFSRNGAEPLPWIQFPEGVSERCREHVANNSDTLNVRIMFVDKRRGPVSSAFQQAAAGGYDSSGLSADDSDIDDSASDSHFHSGISSDSAASHSSFDSYDDY